MILISIVINESYVIDVQTSVKVVFVRGSVVRYVHIPRDAVDTELLQDAATKEASLKR